MGESWIDEDTGEFVDFKTFIRNQYKDDEEWVDDTVSLTAGTSEMLRITPDGFYVRGVRVEADAKEAKLVYDTFKQWLVWATLSNDR